MTAGIKLKKTPLSVSSLLSNFGSSCNHPIILYSFIFAVSCPIFSKVSKINIICKIKPSTGYLILYIISLRFCNVLLLISAEFWILLTHKYTNWFGHQENGLARMELLHGNPKWGDICKEKLAAWHETFVDIHQLMFLFNVCSVCYHRVWSTEKWSSTKLTHTKIDTPSSLVPFVNICSYLCSYLKVTYIL